ncbi:alcohol dehydrogenase [Devosia pacifica]|uniref:Alcohol dehydrogenase n=2 Tax=Devosia pacifica TaxID=1335967 RepID=A0A918S493_9HYPH|nr:alcohol dehydrogenase [Devosia pacifica]
MHCTSYGPPEVLELREVDKPTPRAGDVVLRVHAATVTLGDCEVRAFKLADWIWLPARLAFGILKPRQPVLGMEIAGVIDSVGADVKRFKPGDRVFGSTGFSMGAYAEFARLPEAASLTAIPEGMSYAEAASIPTGGLNGLHFVRKCQLQPGETILINGAGGAIGMFAVQLAKAAGAQVVAVDKARKHAMLRSLGADHVIDYQAQDYWRGPGRYDAIIDIVGLGPFSQSVAVLNHGGRYVLGNPKTAQMLAAMMENRRKRIRAMFELAGDEVEDLDFLKHQIADGALRVVIDRSFSLEALPEAHRYVEDGDKTGACIIDVSGEAYARE